MNAVTKLRLDRVVRSTRGKRTEGMRADRHSAPLARTHLFAQRQLVNYRAAVSAPPTARFAKTDFSANVESTQHTDAPPYRNKCSHAQIAHQTD